MTGKSSLRRSTLICLAVSAALCSTQLPSSANTGAKTPSSSVALLPEPSTFKPELPPLDASAMLAAADTRLVVRLGERRVYVYQGDEVKVSYPVAVGRAGWETPRGKFKILRMEKNPAWKNPWTGDVIPPGRNNPMGERAIDFYTDGRNYAAFHGTPNESVIGQAVSHGCIRMRNADIRAMYDMVAEGTEVLVEH
ncbi:L,D-transpeptidase [Pseudanabaena sp. PCC 6802]|uniref:L,D-transpeptidase n=1 Tax=Pseudanabaena sp. PCC 6802 TaxID=118173 RepID=UPI0005644E2E|nr:L,D-transpeptidase [Pseudanabaena sp. PCC 6802]